MKIKVLFIGEFPRKNNLGGGPTVNSELANYLCRNDLFKIKIIAPLFTGEEEPKLNLPIIFIKTPFFRGKTFGDVLVRFHFRKAVADWLEKTDFKPDIFHIDTAENLCCLLPGTPKVLFITGSNKLKNELFFHLRHPYAWLTNYISEKDELMAFHNTDVKKIMVCSETSKKRLFDDYNLSGEVARKLKSVKLGYNISRFSINGLSKIEAKKELLQKFGINENTKILLFVGGISDHKGQRELISSLEEIIKAYKDVILILVGKDSGDRRYCEELIKTKNLTRHVLMIGSVSDKELGVIFRASDIYTSAATEGFGINQVEAMGMELPLVAWDKGAVKELFEDGQEGFLITNRNDFVQKIILLLKDDKLRRKIAENAKKHAEKNYSWQAVGEKIVETYLAIINKSS